jgi:5-methylcytosine-specific restriction enzyme A
MDRGKDRVEMPYAPARVCTRGTNCPHVVTHDRPCPVHGERQPWQHDVEQPRIRGRRLQALRTALFQREPLCRPCSQAGRATVATIRDHIINVEEGGTEDESNIEPICADCHRAKTEREAARGQARGR